MEKRMQSHQLRTWRHLLLTPLLLVQIPEASDNPGMTAEFIPSKVQDALAAPQWKKATDEEMLALKKNK
ncbi:unnamed protein product [Prunus armeniaca]